MLCLHCATPLPPGSSACHRCGARALGRTYSSALIVADTIPETQPEIPTVRVTTLESGVYARPTEAARPVPATTQPVTTIRVALTPIAPASPAPGEPYTLRHLLDATFGAPTRASRLFPRTTIQRVLAERLEARLATNKWISAALGALVAVGVGLGLSVIAQSVVNAALGTALQTEDSSATAAFTGDTFAALLGGNPIKLFLLAQHVPLQLANGASAANGRLSLGAPLTLFALIPVVALLLGGAVASASDFERRARYSVARGALLGPIYAVALLLLSLFSLSPVDGAALNVASVTYIMASPFGAFLSGLAWGTLFGALGGWLHLHGRRSLRALPASLERLPLPRLAGALLGGLTALGAGLLACLGVALAATVYLALNGMAPALSGNLARLPATPGELLTSLTLIVTLAPSLATTLWGFSVGAPGADGAGGLHWAWHVPGQLRRVWRLHLGRRVAVARADSRRGLPYRWTHRGALHRRADDWWRACHRRADRPAGERRNVLADRAGGVDRRGEPARRHVHPRCFTRRGRRLRAHVPARGGRWRHRRLVVRWSRPRSRRIPRACLSLVYWRCARGSTPRSTPSPSAHPSRRSLRRARCCMTPCWRSAG